LRHPSFVLETAAQAVGSKNGLTEHIADKSMLLLFDNFEQVVEASAYVASLLSGCPQLDLFVTSREPLHLTGEQEYAVPPLVHEEGDGSPLCASQQLLGLPERASWSAGADCRPAAQRAAEGKRGRLCAHSWQEYVA